MFGIWAILLIFSVISVVVLIAGGLSYSEESINVLSILKESVENRCFDKYMLGGYYPNESKNGAPCFNLSTHCLIPRAVSGT